MNLIRSLRASMDSLTFKKDRSGSIPESLMKEDSIGLPKEDLINLVHRVQKETTGAVVWRDNLYISTGEDIFSINSTFELQPFAKDFTNTILRCSDFGKLVHGIRALAVYKDHLVSAHETGEIVLWSGDEEIFLRFEAFTTPIERFLVWNNYIVVGVKDHGRMKVFQIDLDAPNAKCVHTIENLTSFSLWGSNLATLVHKADLPIPVREVKVWDTNFECLQTTVTEDPIKYLHPWRRDALVCASEDGYIRVMNEEGNFELIIGTPGADIRSFCVWNGDLVFCEAQTRNFELYGSVEMYNMDGHCDYKWKVDRPALSLVPWGNYLVLRAINTVMIYKDTRFKDDTDTQTNKQ